MFAGGTSTVDAAGNYQGNFSVAAAISNLVSESVAQ
jgi:hypothetical protein